MRRIASIAHAVMLFGLPLAGLPEGAPRPRVRLENAIVDLGVVAAGEQVEATFVLRNEGDAPLHLDEVRSDCGCAVVAFDPQIPPGESGRVRATLETRNLEGAVARGLTVLTDDPESPRLRLTLRAEVRSVIVVEPSYARLMGVEGGGVVVTHHTLWAADGYPLEAVTARSPVPFVEVTVRPADDDERRAEGPARQWRIDVTLAEAAPVGPLADWIEVRTDHPRRPQLQIPVHGFVEPRVAVVPERVDFGRVPAGEPRTASLIVDIHGPGEVRLTGAGSDLPGLTAEIHEERPGRRHQVRLRLAAGRPRGPFQGTVWLTSDSPIRPRLEVPLRGVVE